MSEGKSYKNYFDIDPKYYAAVTEDLINRGDVRWESFYPHESFVKLLEKAEAMLSQREPASLWVEGAYGTGKTHAVLTLKSLLEAPEEKVWAYFADYGLKNDLCQKFLADRNAEKLLTIYRTGSSSIRSDEDLILAVQDSITAALQSKKVEKRGEDSLREAALKWLEKSAANREYFEKLITNQNQEAWGYGPKKIESIIQILKGNDPDLVGSLMRNILRVAKSAGIELRIDANGMAAWIKNIIDANDLSAIVFFWDEFTEYFNNNQNSLTGFQTLVEISKTHPFYFVLVTHESTSLIKNGDTRKKIMDRFVGRQPVAIDLPDNTAFKLMAQAMKTTDDPVLLVEWKDLKNALINDLREVRQKILDPVKKSSTLGEKTQLSEDDLNGIVPIHPYAALLLKHMSVLFNSNARSMFDFIISNDMEDAKGFKWFINEYGPEDEGFNLLTVDMLWDFFSTRSQGGLESSARQIFDSLGHMKADVLSPDQLRVFKTVALLEAVSQRASGVELLEPTAENIDLAFSGPDWDHGQAKPIVDKLCDQGILFQRKISDKKFIYSVVNTYKDVNEYKKHKEEIITTTKTSKLIVEGQLDTAVQLPASINGRFVMVPASAENFTSTANKCRQSGKRNQFQIVLSFAMNDEEAAHLGSVVSDMAGKSDGEFFFIESLTPMGNDLFNQYVENMANSKCNSGKDNILAKKFDEDAKKILNSWRQNVEYGAFMLYTNEEKSGVRCPNLSVLVDELKRIEHHLYLDGLELNPLPDGLFTKNALSLGAECGIKQHLKGVFNLQNLNNFLNTALKGSWKVENYWKDPGKDGQTIVRIKKHVEDFIAKKLQDDGRVSVLEIFQDLQERPYGFMLNNLSAFAMGFLLKEYATPNYFWSNGSQSEPMSIDKMKMAIKNAIDEAALSSPSHKFKEEFIVSMSPEMREFLRCASSAFGISGNDCNSIEDARAHIRVKMKEFSFPLWTLKFMPVSPNIRTPQEKIAQAIDCYCGIANTANVSTKSESELAEQIGKLVMETPQLVYDLAALFTSENCRRGMMTYLGGYRGGTLISLAKEIGDDGAHLGLLKERFSADGNWVWEQKTANEKIDDLILEYKIIDETNKYFPRSSDLNSAVREWNNRCDNIRISSSVLLKVRGDLKPLLEILHHMKLSNQLQNHERQKFYNALVDLGGEFDNFCNNPLETFKNGCKILLGGLTDEDIRTVYYSKLVGGQFLKDQTEYFRYVEKEVKKYIEEQKRYRLVKLWREKTDTKDPSDWSNRYKTPILCMFDDTERAEMKKIFAAFFAGASDRDVEEAISYLERGNFYERLASADERDKCFMERLVGKYAVLLTDTDAVRNELYGIDTVYAWMDNSAVRNKLEILAKKQYMLDGYPRAKSKLDEMDAAQLREYMNRMLEDNLDVGMEILKKGKA